MDIILKYFPDITDTQKEKLGLLKDLYSEWNDKINVISRKDIENIYERHILHSLAIAKVLSFKPNTEILDVGTGGGFPGIPLAIMFPETNFHLIDSIGKKIKVVSEVADALNLNNVKAEQVRAEMVNKKYDFIVSRAVTSLPEFYEWVKNKVSKIQYHSLDNGILYLKGGDLSDELKPFGKRTKLYSLSDFFDEEFFETKKVVYLAMRF